MRNEDLKARGCTPIEDLIAEDFGAPGTVERDEFESSCEAFIIGERLKAERLKVGMTQEQLAIDLNISDRYMRNLEKGEKVPSVDLFVELRERFGSSLDYIVLGVSASQREQELQNQLQMLRKELKEMQRRILVMLEMLGESA